MFRKTLTSFRSIKALVAALTICAANTWLIADAAAQTNGSPLRASPCLAALAQNAVCRAASQHALEIIAARQLNALTVVQDVRTGAVVVVAAARPSELDVTTPIRPLSLAKLLIAACWWDSRQPDATFESTMGKPNAENPAYRSRVSVHEMLVGGSDSAGRQLAITLRRSLGTKAALEAFKRYGFGQPTASPSDDRFWGEVAPAWATRLMLRPAHIELSSDTDDAEWAEALSLGETDMQVTALHVSRFLQAIGNNGVMLMPIAREEQPPSSAGRLATHHRLKPAIRVMRAGTALRLQAAMRDTVRRGTATGIADTLAGTGWQIGGKTGSGPALLPKGPQLDGWFAGLIFDPQGRARFTVATFVRSGGRGGENAARISAELARYLIGEKPDLSR